MAASPKWKVYRGDEYIASCKYLEDAAALVAISPDGCTIREGHSQKSIVWREGREDFTAAESYDGVAMVAEQRATERWLKVRYPAGVPGKTVLRNDTAA